MSVFDKVKEIIVKEYMDLAENIAQIVAEHVFYNRAYDVIPYLDSYTFLILPSSAKIFKFR